MDIEITGHNGFYQLRAITPAGTQFMRKVVGFAHGAAYSDDTRMTQEIADGAVEAGQVVYVNGKEYHGQYHAG
jgi:hypothetical protein